MFRISVLILIVVSHCQVFCNEEEIKSTVKFLLTDAKEPKFDLNKFRETKILEEDNIPSESIILPTVNLESHPYAVVVLPDLNKFASKGLKSGRFSLDHFISSKVGNDVNDDGNEEKLKQNHFAQETEGASNDKLSLSSEIPVFNIIKSKGEIVNVAESIKHLNKSTAESAQTEKELRENVRNDNNNFHESNKLLTTNSPLIKSLERNSNTKFHKITKLHSDDFRTETTLTSKEKYQISPASLERKTRLTFNEFPRHFRNSLTPIPVTENSLTAENTGDEEIFESINTSNLNSLRSFKSNTDLPVIKEFHSIQKLTVPRDDSSTSGKARTIVPKLVEQNPVNTIVEDSKRIDESKVFSSNQEKKSEGSQTLDYIEHLQNNNSNQASQTEPSSLKKDRSISNIHTEGSLAKQILNIDTLKNAFETVSRFDALSSNRKFSESEEYSIAQQKQQLIKLRNQLNLLDRVSIPEGDNREHSSEVNPEVNIGLYKIRSNKETERNTEHEKRVSETKIKKAKEPSRVFIPPSKESISSSDKDPTLSPSLYSKKDSITWGEIFKNSQENINRNPVETTTLLNTENFKFNKLESVKAPVAVNHDLHTRHKKSNQSKEFSVVFEKFDISNAIPSKENQSLESENFQLESEDSPSFSTPELNVNEYVLENNDYTDYLDEEANLDNKSHLSSSLNPSASSESIVVQDNEQYRSFPALLENLSNKQGCDNEGNCIDAKNDLKDLNDEDFIGSPTNVEIIPTLSDTENPKNLMYSTIGTLYPNKRLVVTETVQLTTDTTVSYPHTIDPAQNFRYLTNLPSKKIEGRSAPTLDNFTVTSPIHRASIEPSSLMTTSYILHNPLKLETITKFATVTVMTPSPVIHTHTEVIEQTKYITITKTLPSEPLYTSTILHVMPDPRTVTVSVAESTVISTIEFPSTVIQTVYATECDSSSIPTEQNPFANFEEATNNFVGAETNTQLQSVPLDDSSRESNGFSSFYWPKSSGTGRSTWPSWPAGFETEKFAYPGDDRVEDVDYSSFPDQEEQESEYTLAILNPNPDNYVPRNRQRMSRSYEYDNDKYTYGTPFYGLVPASEDYPTNISPGMGKSLKEKVQ
ncbi:UNVERIFIED_CONTAM: hypothetical protein RMT77_004136 [Armadillidium vulgare]